MSRKFDAVHLSWFALVVFAFVLLPSASPAAVVASAGEVSGNEYEDAVLGAGHAEGDIWGGEQGTDPDVGPDGPVVGESIPLINTNPPSTPKVPGPRSVRTGYLAQLALFFDWLWASLRFADPH